MGLGACRNARGRGWRLCNLGLKGMVSSLTSWSARDHWPPFPPPESLAWALHAVGLIAHCHVLCDSTVPGTEQALRNDSWNRCSMNGGDGGGEGNEASLPSAQAQPGAGRLQSRLLGCVELSLSCWHSLSSLGSRVASGLAQGSLGKF